jgi:hypothetical protein
MPRMSGSLGILNVFPVLGDLPRYLALVPRPDAHQALRHVEKGVCIPRIALSMMDGSLARACYRREGGRSARETPGSLVTRRTARRCQMKSTMIATSVAPISPAPWSGWYQPMLWPIHVAINAPAIPRAAVRTKPRGVFGPGRKNRAMTPATRPTRAIQMKVDTDSSLHRRS